MPTYRLTLEYEGTRYHGWQEQKNARSVAGELRRAIEECRRRRSRELGGSGRTDAGVHALAQVAHLRLARRGRSRAVPPRGQRPPAAGHPRPRARAGGGPLPLPPRRGLPLLPLPDLPPPHGARQALRLVGEAPARRAADGGGRRAARGASTTSGSSASARPSSRARWWWSRSAEVATAGALILVRLSASHFLWKMVRRVVGTLVQVGAGELDRRDFEDLLAAKNAESRKRAARRMDGAAFRTVPGAGAAMPGDPPARHAIAAGPGGVGRKAEAAWRQLGPARPSRYPAPAMNLLYTAHVPAGDGPFPAILALHGWGASAHDLLGLAPVLYNGQALVLCPQGPVAIPFGGGQYGYGWFPLRAGQPPDVAAFQQRGGRSCKDSSTRRSSAIRSIPRTVRRRRLQPGGDDGLRAGALREPGASPGLAALSSWFPPPLAELLPKLPGARGLPGPHRSTARGTTGSRSSAPASRGSRCAPTASRSPTASSTWGTRSGRTPCASSCSG